MRIGLIDVDGKNFPNIALMKISAWHKSHGDQVEWYMPFDDRYDCVYMSKIFSFTPDYTDCINAAKVVKGGTGYAIKKSMAKKYTTKPKILHCRIISNIVFRIIHCIHNIQIRHLDF